MDPNTQELLNTTMHAHEVLMKVETVFPFTLFPDTVTIDREKLTIANRLFFRVAKINSILITDIQSIEANVGPFFGSLHIVSKFFVNNPNVPRVVKFLWRHDAERVQRLIQGFIIAKQKDIDCSQIDTDKLLAMLADLGSGATD